MKWVEHRANSRHDVRVRRLIKKHGLMGFGLYWMVNEIIAEKLDENLECILEAEIEDLSDDMNEPPSVIKELLDSCVHFKLFTKVGEKYQNLKVLKYCDEWTDRKLKKNSRVTPETIPSDSRYKKEREVRQDKKEKDKDSSNVTTATETDPEILKAQQRFQKLKSKNTRIPKAFNPESTLKAIQEGGFE